MRYRIDHDRVPVLHRHPSGPVSRPSRAAAHQPVHGTPSRIAAAVLLGIAGATLVALPATAAPARLPAERAGLPAQQAELPAKGAGLPAKRDSAAATADAESQAALVAAEDERLTQVRAVTAVAPLRGPNWARPYRLDTGSGYTLVLTQQRVPYTVADLLTLAPQTFVRQADGSYLLTENIYLNSGAKLKLTNPGGLTLRMASTGNGFVSIVSFGGELTVEGTPQAPTRIVSWDPRTNKPDTDLRDGRAYLRAIGGQFTMTNAEVSHLGFWSGRTGGVSLTGTDRPNTGDVDGPVHLTKDQRHAAKQERLSGGPEADLPPTAGDVVAQPSGPLTTPDSRFVIPGLSYVSGRISDTTVTGNAFGLFVSSANGITISDTTVADSLHDGVVLHRFASSAVIERVVARGNGGDGFILSRASQQVRVSGATAERNGGNGFTLNGQPLATGPSASGSFTGSYGSNSVANCVSRNNGHYGVEILGGLDIDVQNNEIVGGDMGIVARTAADGVTISGNRVSGQRRHGIALRDGVRDAVVTGNVVTAADNGIYVRDSIAEIRGNTVQDVTNHGIAVVGRAAGSVVSYNVIAGVGPSALDTSRAGSYVTARQNQTYAWHDTSSFWIKFRHYASPMTMLWVGIGLVIVFSAVKGARRREGGGRLHPYADKRPLYDRPAPQHGAVSQAAPAVSGVNP